MYKKILVPLDGSNVGELTLPHARHLAESFSATLELFSAVDIPDGVPADIASSLISERETYLDGVVESLPETLEPKSTVATGHPAEAIIEAANVEDGTLVAIGTHGYTGPKRWFHGGVALKVVQQARVPVFMIPAKAMELEGEDVEFRYLIAPLDGSTVAERVLPHVVSLCRAMDMELILVRVYNPRFPGANIRMHKITEIVHDTAEIYLKEKVEDLAGEGLKKVSYKVLRGISAEAVTDLAIETPNSLTAMCAHGKHGLGREVLGHVTSSVIHCAEEPVLIIHGRDHED
jgi:nucleotide-binding universal stress UspA family protein